MGVGQRLSAARNAKGLSVAEVAAATRLRAAVIERIEADDFQGLDEDVFIRAHLKTISNVVGVDPSEILLEYSGEPVIEASTETVHKGKIDIFAQSGKSALPARRNPTGPLVVLSVVVMLGLVAWVKLGPGANSPSDLLPANLPSESSTVSDSPSADPTGEATGEPTSEPTAEPTPTGVDPSVVTLAIRATAACWFSVTASNGELLLQETLQEGDVRTFVDASELSIRIGNAGALELTVNGVELGAVGQDGQVLDRVFGLGDPNAL